MIERIKALLNIIFIRIKYGKKLNVKGSLFKIHIQSCRSISIKKGNLKINGNLYLKYGARIGINGGIVSIGKDCFFNSNSLCACRNIVKIGDRVSIGPNVCIYDHDHSFGANGKSFPDEYTLGEVEIGKNVWIGAGSIILKNTKIGDNTIIGAGTVVKGNIPPNSIVTNNRNMIIKKLVDRKENEQHE